MTDRHMHQSYRGITRLIRVIQSIFESRDLRRITLVTSLLVIFVLLPELIFELWISLFFCRFTELAGYDIIILGAPGGPLSPLT
jgi:hypothetical protein